MSLSDTGDAELQLDAVLPDGFQAVMCQDNSTGDASGDPGQIQYDIDPGDQRHWYYWLIKYYLWSADELVTKCEIQFSGTADWETFKTLPAEVTAHIWGENLITVASNKAAFPNVSAPDPFFLGRPLKPGARLVVVWDINTNTEVTSTRVVLIRHLKKIPPSEAVLSAARAL